MKKCLPIAAGIVLGLLFIAFSLMFLLKLGPTPTPPPKDSPAGMFMGALYPTGYLTFVKVLELLGGILVTIPRTRNLGLLALGPIIVNILAFQIFINGGTGLLHPAIIVITVLPLYLLWVGRKAFAGLLN